MNSIRWRHWSLIALFIALTVWSCAPAAKNSLSHTTGEAGSTIPKAHGPYYPNTAGNIVAPPGNPAGNPAGSPPIVGGTENQQAAWSGGR
jgi:hypothetical protein